jgi:hypothetical protein
MERSISTSRKYAIGNYTNIDISDSIDGIPDSMMLNQVLMEKIRYLQLVSLESAYYKYVELMKKTGSIKQEEVTQFLEEEREQTISTIKNLLTQKEGE